MNILQKKLITNDKLNDKLYEQKYLIYKSKYLKIKNQIGGIFKVGDTPGEPEVILMRKFIDKLKLKCSELQILCETHSKSELFSMIITLSKSSKEEILKQGETTLTKSLKNFMIYDEMLDFCKKIVDKIIKEEKLIQNEEYCLEYIYMIMEIENMEIANMKEYEINYKLESPMNYSDKNWRIKTLIDQINAQFTAYNAFMSYSVWHHRISRHGRHDGSPSKTYRSMTADEAAEYNVKRENKNKRIQELLLEQSEMKKQYDMKLLVIEKIKDTLKSLKIRISQPSKFDSKIFNEIKSEYEYLISALQDLKTQIDIFNTQWQPLQEQYFGELEKIRTDPILESWSDAQSSGYPFFGKD
jgi:hypothetical protein